jgi:Ca2+-binding RTX toxin-like protein
MAAMLVSSGGPMFNTAVQAQTAPVGAGFALNAGDLRFIFRQIEIAQQHSSGVPLFPNLINEPRLPFGLRAVDGSNNHLVAGTTTFGASDQLFPRMTTPNFRPASNAAGATAYTPTGGDVVDPRPRVISNLIVDQTERNPSARAIVGCGELGQPTCASVADPLGTLAVNNVAPDAGLSAPFNSMFTFFGQFFDHGLDLVNKGSGNVMVPLQADDPLVTHGTDGNAATTADNVPVGTPMVLSRARRAPGSSEAVNQTTPFVDQNQTYTSHPSHQVFLRDYVIDAQGNPRPTGRVLDGPGGNIGNWAEVKANALKLGIILADADVFNVPSLQTDSYGHIRRNGAGRPLAFAPNGATVVLNPAAPVPSSALGRINHEFLNDVAHEAVPGPGLTPDADNIVSSSSFATGARVVTPPQAPGTYDNELLDRHFITGDGRGNENVALTAVHTVFHSEHNRLQVAIGGMIEGAINPATGLNAAGLTAAEQTAWLTTDTASGWTYGERLFQAAKFGTEMQYQHLVFEEFARKMVPSINPFIGDGINFVSGINPAIVAEFAHQTYRLGHSMLTETIARTYEDGSDDDIPLLDAFLNPLEFTRNPANAAVPLTASQAAGAIFQGGTRQVANEIDEFVTEAVRNRLVGLPLDLAVLNIARGRSEGIAALNPIRQQLYAATGDGALLPYTSWFDFAFAIRHPESMVNFIAAYGQHPNLTGTMAQRRAAAQVLLGDADFMFAPAAVSGLDDVDLWVGGLAEKVSPFGGLLGPTFSYIFEIQLESLQNADRFYYLERLDGLNFLTQLEGNSFVELIARNTTLNGAGSADVFARPDFVFNMSAQVACPPGTANPPVTCQTVDDPSTVGVDESVELVRMLDGTVRYNGPAHVIFNGRDDGIGDRIWSSEGDDTLRGNGGNDRIEGGAGNDNHIGGAGDDILIDNFGDDVMKGGPGNDAISGGSGPFDLLQGNEGNDFIVAGPDLSEIFGGLGNDIFYMGKGLSESIGGAGDDWIEGTESPASIAIGDDNNQFQNDPFGGHDIGVAGLGDMDFDMEGGDDIMVGNVIPTHRFEGMLGFDWVTYRGEVMPVDADMLVTGAIAVNAPLNENRDRMDLIEGLSGTNFNDLLRGDNRLAADLANDGLTGVANGHVLNAAGIARITGLAAILPPGATSWGDGNIILGGAGSDLLEGRGGDDILDGDRWLNVQLTAPNPAGGPALRVDSLQQLKTAVFAGQINPGSITYIREIISTDGAGNIDTAVFTGPRANYTVVAGAGRVTVTDNVGLDGVDTLFNIELLQFADVTENSPVPSAQVNVPNVVLQTQATATQNLVNAGFLVVAATANSNTVAAGRVISQNPAGGTQAVIGSTVGIVVSIGPLLVAVPNVVGSTLAGATTSLQSLGFVVTSTTVTNAAPAGQVIAQNPAPGNAPFGSTVALTVSAGPAVAGLVAAFGFEEAAGTALVDSAPGPINGVLAGGAAAPTRVAIGKFGRALSFDGADSASVPDGAVTKLDLSNGMTLEAWVNPTTMSGWESVLYKERGGPGTGLLSYALYAHDGGANTPAAGYVRTSVGGPDRGIQGLTRLPLNVWSHIAVTYTTAAAPASSSLRFYVNGALVRTLTTAVNQNILAGTQPLRIGNSNASISEGFNGLIDEIRIYNRALSAAEIVTDMGVPIVQ